MSLAYKVEELLALRDSVSESAVSIDKFADEDAIKEHVLRPSASAHLIGASSEKRLPTLPTPSVAPAIDTLKKPSPSPSVKRGKAERLLKEHGSPPGMRVTAGGRVVPSDLQPLGGARFGNNTFKPQVTKDVDSGITMAALSQSDANSTTPQVQVIGTQAVIRVGDRMFALPTYNPTFPMPSSVPPMLEINKQPTESAMLPGQGRYPSMPLAPQRSKTQDQFMGADLVTLKTRRSLKQQELRSLEQTEVLQADHQPPAWRMQVVARKRSLVTEIDALRRQIEPREQREKAHNAPNDNIAMGQATGLSGSPDAIAPNTFTSQFQQPMAQPVFSNMGAPLGVPTPNPFSQLMMFPSYAGPQSLPPNAPPLGRERQPFASGENVLNGAQLLNAISAQGTNVAQSPGSAGRRSHAIEIKPPRNDTKKQAVQGFTLDPKSPTYEPVAKVTSQRDPVKQFRRPTPSPAKQSPWRSDEVPSARSDMNQERTFSRKPSLSSVDTTDFFPTNTHEHSSTRIATNKVSKKPSRDHAVLPTTPEKSWPAGPWNSQSGGRSDRSAHTLHNSPSTRLTTWPEAYGKASSGSSSFNKTIAEPEPVLAATRKNSSQTLSAEHNWQPFATKPVPHLPSTYQEGYQAGLLHLGLPGSFEVLCGYLDGLKTLLKEPKDCGPSKWNGMTGPGTSSARSSLRGYLSGGTPQDSAVGFNENVRLEKVNSMPTSRNLKADTIDAPIVYALCNEAMQNQHTHTSPVTIGHKKDEQSREEFVPPSPAYPRQYSGNQVGSRVSSGTPASMRRHNVIQKEYTPGSFHSEASPGRLAMGHRLSGLDGAMDDLAGLVVDAHLDESEADADVSCFRPSSGKGKQKAASSPDKMTVGKHEEVPSPDKKAGSPKKPGEQSPAKARLEQVTSKLRRPKKDDPRTMSPEDKQKRADKWRQRFQGMRRRENEEIDGYVRENTLHNPRDGARR